MIMLISCVVMVVKDRDLGRYCRTNPLVFSLVPRLHGLSTVTASLSRTSASMNSTVRPTRVGNVSGSLRPQATIVEPLARKVSLMPCDDAGDQNNRSLV